MEKKNIWIVVIIILVLVVVCCCAIPVVSGAAYAILQPQASSQIINEPVESIVSPTKEPITLPTLDLNPEEKEEHESSPSLDKQTLIPANILKQMEKIEQDLVTAVEKEKDDIARLLIKKRIKTDQQIDAFDRHAESLEKQIGMLNENIEAQKHQYAEMQLRSEIWLQKAEHRQWEESASSIIPHSSLNSISDEEVELELIKCKDAIKGGA